MYVCDELAKALAFNNYSPGKMRSVTSDLNKPYSFNKEILSINSSAQIILK